MELLIRPIGIIHSPLTDKIQAPPQATRSEAVGEVEVYAEFAAGLKDIEGFSHLILLYFFHESSGYQLHVKPFLDNQLRGVFATRHPCRPNPIGLSTVRLLGRRGNELDIAGIDMLDGTPLIDIKPYVADVDTYPDANTGWYRDRTTGDKHEE